MTISARAAFLMFRGTLYRLDSRFGNNTRSFVLTEFIRKWSVR